MATADETSPLYLTKVACYVNCNLYPPDSAVRVLAWPNTTELEPLNESARKIVAYYQRRRLDPFLPSTPFDRGSGRIYLPAMLTLACVDEPSWPHLPPQPDPVLPSMPLYKVTGHKVMVGRDHVERGATVVYLGWPRLFMEPANEVAQRIVEWVASAKGRINLPPSPWNDFDNELWLPNFDATAQRRTIYDPVPQFSPAPRRPSQSRRIFRPVES